VSATTTATPLEVVASGLAALQQAAALVRTSVEDCPDDPEHRPDHKALTDLGDAVDDLLDAVAEAQWTVRAGPREPAEILTGVHRSVLRAAAVLRGDLLRLDRRFDVARRAARTWGGAWRPWSGVVLTNLLDADDALRATEHAVAAAWAAVLPAPPRPTHRPAPDSEASP
jgi:hypothetical protein